MKCYICGKDEAVLHIKEVVCGKQYNISICKNCEKNHNIIEKCVELEFNNLDIIFPNYKSIPRKKKRDSLIEYKNKICKYCGYSIEDYFDTNNVSCPKCYDSFRELISKDVKKKHKYIRHIGKVTNKNLTNKDIEEEINRYKETIELLIKTEKFEEAAIIRNKLKELEQLLVEKKILSEKKDVHQ